MALGKLAVVMAGPSMTRVYSCDAVPIKSSPTFRVAVTVKLKVPVSVGVPESALQVLHLHCSVIPLGREPVTAISVASVVSMDWLE